MKCHYCGQEIDEGSVFCGYCGKKQPQVKYCIKCGQEIGLEDIYCGYCGTSQNVEKTENNIAADLPEEQEEQNSTNVTNAAQNAKRQDEEPVVDGKDEDLETVCLDESSKLENDSDKSVSANNIVQEPIKTEKVSYNKETIITVLIVLVLALIGGFWSHYSSKSGMTVEAVDSDSVYTNENIDVYAIDTAAIDTAAIEFIETATASTEKEITARIEYMFDEVYKRRKNGDLYFLTIEYKDLLKKEQEVTPDGEIGYIDWDHWTQSQECENPSMTVESVEVVSEKKARVMVKIRNSDNHPINVEIVLLRERGDWYVDDFIGMDGSEKEGLKDYIAAAPKNKCPKCGGHGVIDCRTCGGSGRVWTEGAGSFPCVDCGGEDYKYGKVGSGKIKCPTCKGKKGGYL